MTSEGVGPINILTVEGNVDLRNQETELQFADGRTVRIPTDLFHPKSTLASSQTAIFATQSPILIPLVEERLQVAKRMVETGKVRLEKSAEAYEVTLDEPLVVSTWGIKRVPKHEIVQEAPNPRQEGSTTIYSVVEERLVLVKELVLIEEVCVTHETSERRDNQAVTLHRETLTVHRESTKPSVLNSSLDLDAV